MILKQHFRLDSDHRSDFQNLVNGVEQLFDFHFALQLLKLPFIFRNIQELFALVGEHPSASHQMLTRPKAFFAILRKPPVELWESVVNFNSSKEFVDERVASKRILYSPSRSNQSAFELLILDLSYFDEICVILSEIFFLCGQVDALVVSI